MDFLWHEAGRERGGSRGKELKEKDERIAVKACYIYVQNSQTATNKTIYTPA